MKSALKNWIVEILPKDLLSIFLVDG